MHLSITDVQRNYPSVVCAADGRIAAESMGFKTELPEYSGRDNIGDVVDEGAKVIFDIVMNSTKPRSYIAAAKMLRGFTRIRTIPFVMGDVRLCLVVFHREEDPFYEIEPLSDEEKDSLVNDIVNNHFVRRHADNVFPMIDLGDSIKKIAYDIIGDNGWNMELDTQAMDGHCYEIYSEMGLQNFVYLMSSALTAANELWGRKTVSFNAVGSHMGYSFEMLVSCSGDDDGIDMMAATTDKYMGAMSLCDLVAKCSGAELSYELMPDGMKLTLSEITDGADQEFRSHYRYDGYGEMLAKAYATISLITSREVFFKLAA